MAPTTGTIKRITVTFTLGEGPKGPRAEDVRPA